MKIAMKIITNRAKKQTVAFATLGFLAGLCVSLMSGQVVAADPSAPNPPSPPSLAAPPASPDMGASAQNVVSPAPPSPMPQPVASAQPLSSPTMNMVADIPPPSPPAKDADSNDKNTDKNLKSLENKVTDSAKDTVKKLGAATTDMSLEDLNSARITVAKIDALIDIEKRLAELDKVREDRQKLVPAPAPVVPQIPVSMFNPQPSFTPPPLPPPPPPAPVQHEEPPVVQPMLTQLGNGIDVNRISGIDGHYSAVLSTGGQTKTVRVGDKLPDGSVVTSITSTEVVLERNGKSQHLSIKGVDRIYGRSL